MKMSMRMMWMVSAFAFSPMAMADTVQVEVEVPPPAVWQDSQGFSHVSIRGWDQVSKAGYPALPVRQVSVLLPPDHRIESVEVIASEMVSLPGLHVVAPAQRPRPLSHGGPAEFTAPLEEVYGRDQFPQKVALSTRVQFFRGFAIQGLVVRPVTYQPRQGTMGYYPSLRLVVNTVADAGLAQRHTRYRGYERDFAWVRRIVDDEQSLSRYALRAEPMAEDWRYVIVTNEAMKGCSGDNSLAALVADKTVRGVTTQVKTVEEIKASGTGADDAEKIRNFIKDAHENHGTDYVLLVGDADMQVVGGETQAPLVPTRALSCTYKMEENGPTATEKNIPSDWYYGALDGTFNGNNNNLWGEIADTPDFHAEVFVGRAPVDSCEELANFVRKTLDYKNTYDPYLKNVYFVGELLFQTPQGDIYADADLDRIRNSTSDSIQGDAVDTKGFNESTFFSVKTLYDKPGHSWKGRDVLSILNGGNAIINHLGHSSTTYNMRLNNPDLESGLSSDKFFFDYSQGCYCGAFDNRLTMEFEGGAVSPDDSFAEHLITSAKGAFAVIMNSRYGWSGGYSNNFHRYFWDAVFREKISRLGEMNAYSKAKRAAKAQSDEIARYVLYELNLFGDPELGLAVSDTSTLLSSLQEMKFVGYEGGADPETQTVTLSHQGSFVLSPVAVSKDSWAKIISSTTTTPLAIQVGVSLNGMTIGSYNSKITITAPKAANNVEIAVRLFIKDDIPTVPTIQAPKDAEEVETLHPTLTVQNATSPGGGLLLYNFEIFQMDSEIPILRIDQVEESRSGYTIAEVASGLEQGTSYFWRVGAVNQRGKNGPWTEKSQFVTAKDAQSDEIVGGCASYNHHAKPETGFLWAAVFLALMARRQRSKRS